MGLFGKTKKDLLIEELEAKLQERDALLTPEMNNILKIKETIQSFAKEANLKAREVNQLKSEINSLNGIKLDLDNQIKNLKNEILNLNDEMLYVDFGLYSPLYDFVNSEQYKERLDELRARQKQMIKVKTAVFFPTNFYFNNSLKQGQKMIADNVKQILFAFNNECDMLINKVKYNNIDVIKKRIEKTAERLNKMNSKMNIYFNDQYIRFKLQEVDIAYEYQLKKQEEKELAKEERARLREEAKVQKEIEEQRKLKKKEQQHYSNAYSNIIKKLKSDPNNVDYLNKKAELEKELEEIDKSLKDIDYRETNKRAGYVYVISNIGSFGENVYKIGMTRRLEPMDRVNELGDASVPFNFDVHAMIFSDDAPALENALHKRFENNKINMVNTRREFFRVSLDEVEKAVKENYNKTVEFIKIPEAEQFRESLQMIKSLE